MKWYEGNIPSAIQQAKEKQALFVVYISGTDDVSKNMDTTWADQSVGEICEMNNCVALKLEANSESCGQFCMIYPVVCVPSTFFIGENGVPLEVTGGHLSPADFIQKIQQVVQMHNAQKSGKTVEPLTSNHDDQSQQGQGATAALAADSSETAPSTEAEPSTSQPSVSTPGPSMEEKMEKARELVRARREEKSKKEADEQKEKEAERRSLGKGLSDLQKYKEEQSRKEMLTEWQKEKEQKKRDKERVREQLARDREEKNARFRAEREERERLATEAKKAKLEEQAATEAQAQAAKMETARLQFRLPDGSSIVNVFSSTDTLQAARDFLTERIGGKFGRFTLSTHHPRRDFTEDNCSQTLLDLDLAPSAIVIVLPGSRMALSRPPSGDDSGGLVTLLFAPFIALWNFLRYFLFSSAPSNQGGATGASSPSPSQQQTDRRTYSSQRDRAQGASGLRRRQDGNITRLSSLQDDDDEDRTTWNGNSTQQM